MEDIRIEYHDPRDLKAYDKNARAHKKKDIEAIRASIREFGFNDPIGIWSDENLIVEGHGRQLAAIEEGITEVPCIRLDHLSDEQRRAYALAHNKTAELSEWDFGVLDVELAGIQEIDMTALGFDIVTKLKSSDVTEDDPPDVPDVPASKPGDIYQLGDHRVMCGDATDADAIAKLMDGVIADISITSPPYGVSDSARLRDHYVRGAEHKKSFYNEHDDDSNEWSDLIYSAFDNMKIASAAQFVNIQMLAANKKTLIKFVGDNVDSLVDIIVWDKCKSAPQMQKNILNNQFEFVFVFSNSNGSRAIPFGDFHGDINNIIQIPVGHNDFSNIHRAVYPMELPAKLMEIASKADTVIDVFGGTGTTLIAAEQMNRKCYTMEIDPKYVDVIVQRWENLTGKKAVLVSE